MSNSSKDLTATVFNHDYLLGTTLPDADDSSKTDYTSIINHDYSVLAPLTSLDTPSKEGQIDYESIINHDYVVNKEQGNILKRLEMMEKMIDQVHKLNVELSAQNDKLNSAVLQLQAEKVLLLSSDENKNKKLLISLKAQAEKETDKLNLRILALERELAAERQINVNRNGFFNRIINSASQLDKLQERIAILLTDNRKLTERNELLSQQLENETQKTFIQFVKGSFK